jgi:hypothetical protein
MPSSDDLIELAEFVRNHVDSFRILEITVAALGSSSEGRGRKNSRSLRQL